MAHGYKFTKIWKENRAFNLGKKVQNLLIPWLSQLDSFLWESVYNKVWKKSRFEGRISCSFKIYPENSQRLRRILCQSFSRKTIIIVMFMVKMCFCKVHNIILSMRSSSSCLLPTYFVAIFTVGPTPSRARKKRHYFWSFSLCHYQSKRKVSFESPTIGLWLSDLPINT